MINWKLKFANREFLLAVIIFITTIMNVNKVVGLTIEQGPESFLLRLFLRA